MVVEPVIISFLPPTDDLVVFKNQFNPFIIIHILLCPVRKPLSIVPINIQSRGCFTLDVFIEQDLKTCS